MNLNVKESHISVIESEGCLIFFRNLVWLLWVYSHTPRLLSDACANCGRSGFLSCDIEWLFYCVIVLLEGCNLFELHLSFIWLCKHTSVKPLMFLVTDAFDFVDMFLIWVSLSLFLFQFDKYAPKLDNPFLRHSSVSVNLFWLRNSDWLGLKEIAM